MIEPPPTAEEALAWEKISLRIARNAVAKTNVSLGVEDFAAEAVEKLLLQPRRPENIEAWLKTVIRRSLIDRARKMAVRPRRFEVPPEDVEEVTNGLFRDVAPSLASLIVERNVASRLLAELSDKDQSIVLLISRDWDTQEIANELGYKSSKVVANRLKIIRHKMIAAYGEDGKDFLEIV
jgi:RNA polymerase sigma factor (sigma-70 family)